MSTSDGTVTTADSDYAAVTQTFTVMLTANANLEDDETVSISMDNLSASSLSIDITVGATLTIIDDDNSTVLNPIPTLGEWGIIILFTLFYIVGLV